MREYNFYLIALLSLLAGVLLSIFFSEAHFYTFFSLGVFMLFLGIYNSLSSEKLFHYWRFKHFIILYISLVVLSIFIDQIGMALGYWVYPSFNSIFDEVLKYVFEWIVALSYLALSLAIGIIIFKKRGFGKKASFILSLLIFVTIVGFITEYFNSFSLSWKVLSMPITDYKIGNYFIIFQTIGYWVMALIPFSVYKIIERLK